MPSTYTRDDEGSDLYPAPSLTASAVTTRPERRMASGHWLLASTPSIPTANADWKNKGAAWLRPGALFTAVAVSAAVLHAAAEGRSPQECAPRLQDWLAVVRCDQALAAV